MDTIFSIRRLIIVLSLMVAVIAGLGWAATRTNNPTQSRRARVVGIVALVVASVASARWTVWESHDE